MKTWNRTARNCFFVVARLTVGTNWSFVINKCDNVWSTSAMPVFEPFPVMTVGVTIRVTIRVTVGVTIRETLRQHTEGPCEAGSHCNCLTGTTGIPSNMARPE